MLAEPGLTSTFTRGSVSGLLEPSPSAVGWLLWWETIMEVENSVSRRGYNGQALPLAHMQKSVHFNWAYIKVNRLWFLGGKLHLFQSCVMCKLGTFALGQGVWVEIGATLLV